MQSQIHKNNQLEILKNNLKELFQLNNNDLDFGIYKIYGVLNEKLNNWIDNELATKVQNTFDNISKESLGLIEEKLDKKTSEINEKIKQKNDDDGDEISLLDLKLGNLENLLDKFKKGKINEILSEIDILNKELIQKKEEANSENVVYEYIIRFYESIYSDGDYIIPRKNIIGNDINEEDVIFDWKTKDQILIKNMDVQTYFSFETNEKKNNSQIEFKVIDIIDYGDNNKNKSRFLIPVNFILEDSKIIIEFVLAKFDSTTFNFKIEEETIENKIKKLLNKINSPDLKFEENKISYKNFIFGEKENALLGKVEGKDTDKIGVLHLIKLFLDKKENSILKNSLFSTEENGILDNLGKKEKILDFRIDENTNSLLAKNLRKWYRMGTSDFFLSPNLSQELNEYKTDFIKDKMLFYLLEATKGTTNKANVLKAFEIIVNEINTFISTIEDIQVQLFNRKKYIYETHYIITFDKLKLLDLSENNKDLKQFLNKFIGDNFSILQEEYIKLGLIKTEDKQEDLSAFIDFILQNNKLYIDTKLFTNKIGNNFIKTYSKTFELLYFISEKITFINKNIGEKEEIFEILQKLSLIKSKEELKGFKLDLDKLLNGEIYKGDNYHGLNLLKNKYSQEIKTIYIDPPYNTGSDGFLYKDNMKHSTWLTMMQSRLNLAKDLMKDDSVIFSSIDDNEQDNLKKLQDKIFGEKNFIGNYSWFKSSTPPNLSKKIKKNLEYVFGYQKENNDLKFKGTKKYSKSNDPFTKPQNTLKKLIFKPGTLIIKSKNGEYGKGLYGTEKYPNNLLNNLIIKNKTNLNEVIFENTFVWTQEKLEEELLNGTKMFLTENSLVLAYKKAFYDNEVPPNIIDRNVDVETTEFAGNYLKDLFNKDIFKYPKPFSLIKYLSNFISKDNDIILDFFPGSGTTADAVMRLNQEDGGNRKFILTEINDYFDSIIIPRIKKIAYSLDWKNGKAENNGGGGGFFKYSYLENYEDTLENFKMELSERLKIEENDLENDLCNLALTIGIAFENSKIDLKNYQLKNDESYPSYKLANKRDDIYNFVEEKYDKKYLKSFVDLVHYYPLQKEGKWKLNKVEKESGEFIFEYIDEKGISEKLKLEDIIIG